MSDFSRDEAYCYDLFNGKLIGGHDPFSNFTKYPHLSLPLSHTSGGNMPEAGYRNLINLLCRARLDPHHKFIRARVASR